MPSPLSVRRFWFTNFCIASLFIIIGYQLFQLGVVQRPALLELANKQHYVSVDVPPLRGQILDRKGKELATNLLVPSVYAVPRLIAKNQKQAVAEKMSQILGIPGSLANERLARDKAFVWVKRRATFEEAAQIRKLNSAALGITDEFRRFYPQGDLLAQVIGFTDIDSHGLEGIERHLDHELAGHPGRRHTKRDARGREIKAFEIKAIPAVDGHSVTLTIDQYLQYLTERALDRAFKQWKAKGAAAIVMDPSTGEILAIANRPTFDANRYERSSAETRRNRAITDMYEPGSVFKIVTASAAFNEGKVTLDQNFDCEYGEYRYGSRILHDVHPYGDLTFEEVIVKSSNIGTVKIAALLNPNVFQNYVEGFGFGKRTGIDLHGEAPGYTRPVKEWSKTSPYNVPIGQEVMVTVLQMTTAMAVIANGGNLVRPYLIAKVTDRAGVVIRETKPLVKRQVITPETAKTIRRILTRAVEEGTGKKAMIDGVPVGGKTGTAQKVLPNGRGYSHSNFMGSFVGFAPSHDPKFVMVVVLDDPRGAYYGGTVAAPVFKEVMETALFAMGYVPEPPEELEPIKTIEQELPRNRPMLAPAQSAGRGF